MRRVRSRSGCAHFFCPPPAGLLRLIFVAVCTVMWFRMFAPAVLSRSGVPAAFSGAVHRGVRPPGGQAER
ncbi:conserved protein of unknown function [Burkholderia multivorans]